MIIGKYGRKRICKFEYFIHMMNKIVIYDYIMSKKMTNNTNYICMLPNEILDIIYKMSIKIHYTNEWSHAYGYCRLHDCSRQHRTYRKKTIYCYDYFRREWRFWMSIV